MFTRGHNLLFDNAPQHRILRLIGDEWYVQFAGKLRASGDLLGGPFRYADIQGFTLSHDVGEGEHRLFQRCLNVKAMSLIEIHVIGSQTFERPIDGFQDVFA